MAMNRGEWSEFYAILALLSDKNVKIGNEKLEVINDTLYKINKLSITERDSIVDYVITHNNDVKVFYNDDLKDIIDSSVVSYNKDELIRHLREVTAGNGAFEIDTVQNLLLRMSPQGIIKSKSKSKEDLRANIHDNTINNDVELNYSIKSCIGSPATILNASSHTNFIYKVENIDVNSICEINSIDTRTKLLDRYNKIMELGGQINFDRVECPTFDYNLRIIDTAMPQYLANILLKSYITGEKSLKELFLANTSFDDDNLALRKLGDFLEGVSFGMFPSVRWDGINSVNGGLIVVRKDGKVIVLDLIYFRELVLKYLINETKLDSPSSTRYHMFELYKENEQIYFKLNLQIRYKK